MTPLRSLFAALGAVTLGAGASPAGSATSASAVTSSAASLTLADLRVDRPEEEILIFALQLQQVLLSTSFPGYEAKGGLRVPLGELCRQLELGIQVDAARGLAEGTFITEQHRFRLDLAAGTVEIDGRRQAFDRARVELHDDDIFVDTRLIAAWLPLDLQVGRRTLSIQVTPRVPLPLQERWKREQAAARIRPEFREQKPFPRMEDPYLMFEVPMVDETLSLAANNTPGADHRPQLQSTTYAAGDFLGLTTRAYANVATPSGSSDFRVTMGRRDPNSGLLGPLKATEFAFGEVSTQGLNLVSSPMSGTGAMLTNYPLQLAGSFDRHTFQGDLPPGWQVEIYRNQALVGFQASRPDGRYEFPGVPLYFGWNDFRLVFYGPQGQRREEVVHFDVSGNQIPVGAFYYRVANVDPQAGGRRDQLEAFYGLSKQFSASLGVSDLDLNGQRHTYTQADLEGFWKALSASLTAAQDNQGGTIEALTLRSLLGSTSLTALHAELQDGFASETFSNASGQIRSRTSLDTSTQLPRLDKALVTINLGGSEDRLVNGGKVDSLYNTISTSYRGYYVSNQLSRTQQSIPGLDLTTNTGTFMASKFFRTYSVRGQATYDLDAGRRLTSLGAFVDTSYYQPFYLRGGITRNIQIQDTQLQLGAYKTQGAYSLGVDLNYSRSTRLQANLTLRLGLAREPRYGRIHTSALGYAAQGAISARAFIDRNGNGVMEPTGKPVEGAGFLVNGGSRPDTTDARGVAFIPNLGDSTDANIAVASSTLEDPLMRSVKSGVRITPRAGHIAMVDVPLVIFGEVTGTAYLLRDGASRELASLLLELVDAQGRVVKRVRTSYDGFYDLTELSPGAYSLRVAEADARRLGIALPPPKALTLLPEGTVVDGLDWKLTPAAAPATPATGAEGSAFDAAAVKGPMPLHVVYDKPMTLMSNGSWVDGLSWRLVPAAAPASPGTGAETSELQAAAAKALVNIHFDYGKAEIREMDRATLQGIAEFMKAYPRVMVEIAGHCDQRGTPERNLVLGHRRAAAALAYLKGLGVDGSRFTTLSRGHEQPLCSEAQEACWSQNRRDEFKSNP